MITYRLNQFPPEFGLMGVEHSLLFRLLEDGFKVKCQYNLGKIHARGKAFHFSECEITFTDIPDIIKFINFVDRISIGLDSITMLEAGLKSYYKYPERPGSPELLKD